MFLINQTQCYDLLPKLVKIFFNKHLHFFEVDGSTEWSKYWKFSTEARNFLSLSRDTILFCFISKKFESKRNSSIDGRKMQVSNLSTCIFQGWWIYGTKQIFSTKTRKFSSLGRDTISFCFIPKNFEAKRNSLIDGRKNAGVWFYNL